MISHAFECIRVAARKSGQQILSLCSHVCFSANMSTLTLPLKDFLGEVDTGSKSDEFIDSVVTHLNSAELRQWKRALSTSMLPLLLQVTLTLDLVGLTLPATAQGTSLGQGAFLARAVRKAKGLYNQTDSSSQGSGQSTGQVEVNPSAVSDACQAAVKKASPCFKLSLPLITFIQFVRHWALRSKLQS